MVEQGTRSVGDIEADIAATRIRLAGTIDEIALRARPQEVVRRLKATARIRFIEATHKPEGGLRTERLAAAAAAVLALVGLVVLRRRRG